MWHALLTSQRMLNNFPRGLRSRTRPCEECKHKLIAVWSCLHIRHALDPMAFESIWGADFHVMLVIATSHTVEVITQLARNLMGLIFSEKEKMFLEFTSTRIGGQHADARRNCRT